MTAAGDVFGWGVLALGLLYPLFVLVSLLAAFFGPATLAAAVADDANAGTPAIIAIWLAVFVLTCAVAWGVRVLWPDVNIYYVAHVAAAVVAVATVILSIRGNAKT